MSARTLCPEPDLGCERCLEVFADEHPGAEAFEHVYHFCECPWIATVDGDDICVGCGKRRDLAAEFDRVLGGWPKGRAA